MNHCLKTNGTLFLVNLISFVGLFFISQSASAAATDLGSMASTITANFKSVAELIGAGSYVAGLAFSIGAIMKFKQHKDNPTQVPIGTPVALVFIGAALLFLPSILDITGYTMFGATGTTAGASGSATPGI